MKRFIAGLALMGLAACGGDDGTTTPTDSGTLEIVELTVGTGATAALGNTVSVHYIGGFPNGQIFDTSYGGNPFTLRLGAGQVIPGFEQGIVGMRVGGKRRVTMPPSLAYGSQGRPPTIPPNSTLVFEIELMSIIS